MNKRISSLSFWKQIVPVAALSFVFSIVACSDDSGNNSSAETSSVSLQSPSFEDLPNCSKNRNGDIAEVLGERKAYLCDNGRWVFDHDVLDSVQTEEDLSACLSKNEGDSVWVVSESAVFACFDRKWEKHAKEEPPAEEEAPAILTYESEDDLPNCSKDRNGVFAMLGLDVVHCEDGRWENLGHAYATELDMPNCTSKREGEKVFIVEEGISLVCSDKRWMDPRDIVESSSSEEVASSSSKKTSSSSSKKDSASSSSKVVEKSSDSKSSSSKKVESSSSIKSSSSVKASSSSAVSSSSKKVESSSRVKSSSSVKASSSSAVSSSSKKVESSSSIKSSSSVKASSSSAVSSSSKKVESSSSIKSSSSVKASSSSAVSSSSKKVESSSSITSSSSVQSSSSQVALNTQYDCSKYNCVTTQFLNQEMLAAGKYGEFRDLRDDRIYRTIKIGTQVWMAQSLSYFKDVHAIDTCSSRVCEYDWAQVMDIASSYNDVSAASVINPVHQGICPIGFHVPTNAEFQTLYNYVTNQKALSSVTTELNSSSAWKTKTGDDEFGFSMVPNSSGGRAAFWTASEVSSAYRAYRWFKDYEYNPYSGDKFSNTISDEKFRKLQLRCLQD